MRSAARAGQVVRWFSVTSRCCRWRGQLQRDQILDSRLLDAKDRKAAASYLKGEDTKVIELTAHKFTKGSARDLTVELERGLAPSSEPGDELELKLRLRRHRIAEEKQQAEAAEASATADWVHDNYMRKWAAEIRRMPDGDTRTKQMRLYREADDVMSFARRNMRDSEYAEMSRNGVRRREPSLRRGGYRPK